MRGLAWHIAPYPICLFWKGIDRLSLAIFGIASVQDLEWRFVGGSDVDCVNTPAFTLRLYPSSHGRFGGVGPGVKGGRLVRFGRK